MKNNKDFWANWMAVMIISFIGLFFLFFFCSILGEWALWLLGFAGVSALIVFAMEGWKRQKRIEEKLDWLLEDRENKE